MSLEVHLNRLEEWEEEGFEGLADLLRRGVRRALAEAAPGARGELSLTCLPLEEMAELNREYLGREGTTDVIAFDLGEGERVLGDVYVAPEMARRAADEGRAEDARRELVRLAIHGALHVAGQEHPEDEGRWSSPMFRLQERLLDEVTG